MLNNFKRNPFSSSFPLISNLTLKRSFFTVIPQGYIGYRQLLGYNRILLQPGVRLRIPLIHDLKKLDMREGNISVNNMEAITRDNILVNISGSLFYKVVEAEKACFSVQDYLSSCESVGKSTVRSIIGSFTFDEINSDRNEINTQLLNSIGKGIETWGVNCTRFEMQNFEPLDKKVQDQLIKQMEAEREKRKNNLEAEAFVRTAESKKQAAVLESQGLLEARTNEATAVLILAQKQAEAERYTVETVAGANALEMEMMTRVFGGNSEQAANFIVQLAKLKHLGSIAANNSNNNYFFPESSNLLPSSLLPLLKTQNDISSKNL